MNEKEQLIELNNQMRKCIDTVNRIEEALVGNDLGTVGIIKRIDTLENKLKKLDKYMWMLIGMFSLGTIPLGTKIFPLIKDYIK